MAIFWGCSTSMLVTARNAGSSSLLVVQHREVVLVMNHRRAEHLVGQREELRREHARHHRRVLHEVGDLVQQRRLRGDAATEPPRMRIELPHEPVMTLGVLEQDEVLAEPLLVVADAADLDGPAGTPAHREEAMAVGERAGAHVLHEVGLRARAATNHEGDHAAAEQEQHPADRPAERELALAVVEPGVPPHLLGERQVAQRRPEHVGQHVDGGAPTLTLDDRQVLALRGGHARQFGHLDAVLAREARPRRAWACHRRAKAADTAGPLTFSSRSDCRSATRDDVRREAARRGAALDGTVGREAEVLQPLPEALGELLGQGGQPRRGEFLAANLEQKFAIHPVVESSPGRPRRWSRGPRHRPPHTPGRSPRPVGGRAGCTRSAR